MFRSTSTFDKLLDKATSNLRLEPDWPAILQICDLIRQGDVQAKYALAAVKKKLLSTNPHVSMFGLIVLESAVKNCGSLIHDEVGTKAFMEQLREFVKTTPHDNVKAKTLELIQAWAFAFRNSPKYRAVQDTMNIMKAEDYKFPVLKESDAMFSADTAPEWAEGDCCHRCRVQFGLVQRKHHCRACGQVFCSQCSSRTCTLPKFGIEKEVRVCEACYIKLNKPTSTAKQNSTEELPVEYLTSSLAQQNQAPPPRKSEDELREEEELQLALALSQSEAEEKTKLKTSRNTTPTRVKTYSPPPAAASRETSGSPALDDVDPDLARYLNRSYWETRTADESSPSAPSNPPSTTTVSVAKQNIEVEHNGVASDSEMEEFVRDLKGQVEIFVNRMKSNSSRGRSIANDSSVQKLFMNITAMHSKLLHYIQQQDDSRVYYEGLQDKLVQVKDARAALDALRDEHREKLRREAEMAERQRQHQMAQKLDIMRKKKQEYLQYQRQLTLQRIQEQEREMQMRQEQQKQQYLMGSQYPSLGYIPQGGFESLPPGGYAVQPPGFPHFPSQGIPGMMMSSPQGYMLPPGAPPGPGMNQMMPAMGSLPQMMGQMSRPQGQVTGPQGPMSLPQGPMQGPQGPMSLPQGPMQGPQGPMSLPQGPMQGPQGPMSHQGPMQGPQGPMSLPQGPMQGPQGPMSLPQGPMQGPQGPMSHQGPMQGPQGPMSLPQGPVQGQVPVHQGQIPQPHNQLQGPGPQNQLHMPQSHTQIPTQGNIPNQTQNPAQSQLPPNQGQIPHMPSQHQMVPGAPMSPPSMGQPYQQEAPPQEQTAELISFD